MYLESRELVLKDALQELLKNLESCDFSSRSALRVLCFANLEYSGINVAQETVNVGSLKIVLLH